MDDYREELISSYLTGSATCEERTEVERLLLVDGEFRDAFESTKAVWEMPVKKRRYDHKAAWDRVKDNLPPQVHPKPARVPLWRQPTVIGLALAASLLIVFGLILYGKHEARRQMAGQPPKTTADSILEMVNPERSRVRRALSDVWELMGGGK